MNLKNISVILLMIGIMAISIASVSAEQHVTVDGVDFVLSDDVKVTLEQDTMINFYIKEQVITGCLSSLSGNELEEFTQNNTEMEFTVAELNTTANGIKEYAFTDGVMDSVGCLLVFKKDNKDFVYYVECSGGTEEDLDTVAENVAIFAIDNKDLQPI